MKKIDFFSLFSRKNLEKRSEKGGREKGNAKRRMGASWRGNIQSVENRYRSLRLEDLEARLLLATDWIVNTTADYAEWVQDDKIVSLREAIGRASAGDTISFDSELKGKMITLQYGELKIDKALTIDASALLDSESQSPGITISGGGKNRVFYIETATTAKAALVTSAAATTSATVILSGLEIGNGDATTLPASIRDYTRADGCGGGIFNNGNLTINKCLFTDNVAYYHGGGLYHLDGTLTVNDSVFNDNSASSTNSHGGGAYIYHGTASIKSSAFTQNKAAYGAGLRNWDAEIEIEASAFNNNDADFYGGGIYNYKGKITVFESSIQSNLTDGTSRSHGGGVYNAEKGTMKIEYSDLTGNTAKSDGGGLYNAGTLEMVNVTISTNTATHNGGGVYNLGGSILTVADVTIAENGASQTANQLYNLGTASFYNSIVVGTDAVTTTSNEIYNGTASETETETETTGGTLYFAYSLYSYAEAGGTLTSVHSDEDAAGSELFGESKTTDVTLPILEESQAASRGTLIGRIGSVYYYYDIEDSNVWTALAAGTKTYVFDSTDTVNYGLGGGVSEDVEVFDDAQNLTEAKAHVSRVQTLAFFNVGAYALSDMGNRLAPPRSLKLESSNRSVMASWNEVTNASTYTLEYSMNHSFAVYTQKTAASTSVTITGLTKGNTYYFRVKASDLSGHYSDSLYSEIQGITVTGVAENLKAPENLRVASKTTSSLDLTWDKVTGAGGYRLAYSLDQTEWTEKETTSVSVTLSDLKSGTHYYVKVMAISEDTEAYNDSDYSEAIYVSTMGDNALAAPENLQTMASTQTTLLCAWDAVTNAAGYQLAYSTDKKTWKDLDQTAETQQTLSGLTADNVYYFRVMAIAADGSVYADSDYSVIARGYTSADDQLNTPTNLKVTIDSATGVTCSWDKVSNAESYKLAYSSDQKTWIYVTTANLTTQITSLTTDQTYYFKIMALADEESKYEDSYYSGVVKKLVSEKTPLAVPTALTIVSASPTSLTASWNTVKNAAGYVLEYSTDKSSWANVTLAKTSITIDSLAEETLYYFRVKATAEIGSTYSDSVFSSIVSKKTESGSQLETPTGFKVTATTQASITCSWNAVANTSVYRVAYSLDQSDWQYVTSSSTSTTISSLTANVTYYLKVMAVAASGSAYVDSNYSAIISAQTTGSSKLATPTYFNVTGTTKNSISCSWDGVTNASFYRLVYSTDKSAWTELFTVNHSMQISSLVANTTYYLKVMAISSDSSLYPDSDYTEIIEGYTTDSIPLATPANIKTTTTSSSSLTFSWDAVANTKEYRLAYSVDQADWKYVTSETTSVTVSSLMANTTYYAKVMAVAALGSAYLDSDYSTVITAKTTSSSQLSAPTGLNVTASTKTSLTCSWNSVENASQYKLAYSTNQTDWLTATTANTSISISSLTADTTYYLKVMTLASSGSAYTDSDYSAIITAKTPSANQLDTPAKLTASAMSESSVYCEWNSVSGAASYTVAYSTDQTNWTENKATTDCYLAKNLTSNVTYYFKVKAIAASGSGYSDSNYSTVVEVITSEIPPLSTLTNLNATASTETTISCSWNGCVEFAAEKYRVAYSTNQISWSYRETEATDLTLTGLTAKTAYYIKVMAVAMSGMGYKDSEYCAPIIATTTGLTVLNTPVLNLKTKTSETIRVEWAAVPSASNYTVYYSTDSSAALANWGRVTSPVTTVSLIKLSPGTIYYIKAKANAASGSDYVDSNFSAILTVQTETASSDTLPTPTSLTYSSYGGNRVLLSWTGVPDSAFYRVAYSSDGEDWNFVNVTDTKAVVTGLTYGVTYTYMVKAIADSESFYYNSEFSEKVTKVLCPMDANSDGKINLADYIIFASSFGKKYGEDGYDVRADLDASGKVNLLDMNYFNQNFTKRASDPDVVYPTAASTPVVSPLPVTAMCVDLDFVEERIDDYELEIDLDLF